MKPRVAPRPALINAAHGSFKARGASIFPICEPLLFSMPNAGPARDASPVECSGGFATDS